MALSKLDSLYMAVVADHSKIHIIKGKLEDAEQISLNNPTCGDVINLSVKFDAEDRLEDIAFLNSGCTISTASASMMTDAVLGKTKQEILELATIFSEMVQGQKDERQDQLGARLSYQVLPNSHNGLSVQLWLGMPLRRQLKIKKNSKIIET